MEKNKLLTVLVAFITFFLIQACGTSERTASETVVTQETVVRQDQTGTTATTQVVRINDQELRSVRSEWENEYLYAEGSVPVVDRYPDENRNRGLARRGAIADAQRNLAQQISEVRITETVTMRDLEVSDFVRTEMNAVLRNLEVVNETFDASSNHYNVTIRMPLMSVYRVVEQYTKR
ncbi:LPP20 lipoprotein [Cyclonatronum proteinivorum]|uniref:LPP20 lipoprotein n=1 Tax=Cyclonatronum proteinivorum TaxID=1457365 RepID=A0A345UHL2_9BACT|nr:LPP20 family lipoprotein [Cyclonatronum proteinivorum]AXI99963.1 LPP20 lipoprotein [Cyclonatronum proteinivorum]